MSYKEPPPPPLFGGAAPAPTPAPAPQPNKHPSHRMHENSLDAWRSLDQDNRHGQVCRALAAARRPMTDRKVCTALGSADMNYCRPAITTLLGDGVLTEVERVKCPVTGRQVRRVWFAAAIHRGAETRP